MTIGIQRTGKGLDGKAAVQNHGATNADCLPYQGKRYNIAGADLIQTPTEQALMNDAANAAVNAPPCRRRRGAEQAP